jgi:hypothetical protein
MEAPVFKVTVSVAGLVVVGSVSVFKRVGYSFSLESSLTISRNIATLSALRVQMASSVQGSLSTAGDVLVTG